MCCTIDYCMCTHTLVQFVRKDLCFYEIKSQYVNICAVTANFVFLLNDTLCLQSIFEIYTYVHNKKFPWCIKAISEKETLDFLKIDYIVNLYRLSPFQTVFGVRIHSKLT